MSNRRLFFNRLHTFFLSAGDFNCIDSHPSVSYTAVTASQTPSVSYAAVAAPKTPCVSENELFAPRAYHNEYFLSSFEREHFHPDNVTPDRPCTAYFQPTTFNDSSAVFGTLKASSVCC